MILIVKKVIIRHLKLLKKLYKKNRGVPELVFEKINIIIKSIISLTDKNINTSIKYTMIGKKVFQNYGYDIIINQNFKAWILEANSRYVDLPIHNKEDLFIKSIVS